MYDAWRAPLPGGRPTTRQGGVVPVPRTRMLKLAELPPDLRAEAEKWQALGGG